MPVGKSPPPAAPGLLNDPLLLLSSIFSPSDGWSLFFGVGKVLQQTTQLAEERLSRTQTTTVV